MASVSRKRPGYPDCGNGGALRRAAVRPAGWWVTMSSSSGLARPAAGTRWPVLVPACPIAVVAG